jgi:hypothetical protein
MSTARLIFRICTTELFSAAVISHSSLMCASGISWASSSDSDT